MAANNFDTFCLCIALIVMPNSWKDSPAYHGWLQLLLVLVPQDLVVSPRESRTPEFSCTPRNGVQWCQVRLSRGAGYCASTFNPSVARGVIEVETHQDLMARIQLTAGVIRDMPETFPRVRHYTGWFRTSVPPTSMQKWHRRTRFCLTLTNIPDVFWIIS